MLLTEIRSMLIHSVCEKNPYNIMIDSGAFCSVEKKGKNGKKIDRKKIHD